MANKKLESTSTTQGASRREFLERAAGLTGGLLVGFSMVNSVVAPQIAAAADSFPLPVREQLDTWLHFEASGAIKVFTDKVDIGMGIQTAMSQILAEELDVEPKRIQFVLGDTGYSPDQGGVGGSRSIEFGVKPLRNAAATARAVLLDRAAQRLGAPVDQLDVVNGVVSVRGAAQKSVAYTALAEAGLHEPMKVSGTGFAVNAEGRGKPKDPSTYKIVGQPIPREELAEKILGRATYVGDVRVPGMLHGRAVRPATMGATFVSMDDSAAKKVPGFVKAVAKGNFVGVVADNEWGAVKAARELKVTWSNPTTQLPADLFEHMRTATPRTTRNGMVKGDAEAAIKAAAKTVEATYKWPFQAHATMGPGCAVADYQPNGVTTVWCGSQKVHALRRGLAEFMKVPQEKLRVVWTPDAGSYGRAGYEDVAADALLLSEAVGKPVRVQWMRHDMTVWGGKGPATMVDLTAAMDASGHVTGMRFTTRTFSGAEVAFIPDTAACFLAAQLTGTANKPVDEFVQWAQDSTAYDFANVSSVSHVLAPIQAVASPLNATHLRDPNGPAATFAVESFIDELAAAAKVDPIEYRLRYLKDARAKAVIEAAAQKAKWDTRPAPKNNTTTNNSGDVVTGRGIAYGIRGGTHAATVAEVEVNRRTGAIKVKKLVCAHDCGMMINPDGVKGVVAANMIQSMGRALKEEVTFDRAKVTSTDWMSYPVARASDVPEQVEIVLINHPDQPPTGAGEPSTRPTAAALSNAIFDATGIRLRQAPLTAARLRQAMAEAGKAAQAKA
jgi:CO/xanthine dehydrogenase Mo-binding subunit